MLRKPNYMTKEEWDAFQLRTRGIQPTLSVCKKCKDFVDNTATSGYSGRPSYPVYDQKGYKQYRCAAVWGNVDYCYVAAYHDGKRLRPGFNFGVHESFCPYILEHTIK